MTPDSSENNINAYVQLTLMSLLFGGTFIAGRVMATDVSPILGGLLRFIIASLCLLGLLYWQERRLPLPSLRKWGALICLGLTGVFGYNLLLLKALQTIEAGHSAAMISCNPILITLFSCLILGEIPCPAMLLGTVMVIFGVFLVNRPQKTDAT